MKIFKNLLCIASFLTLCTESGSCQEYQLSVEMRVPFIAGLVPVNGKPTAYYELYLTNFSSDSMIIGKVEIFDTSDSSIVASMSNDDLARRYTVIGVPQKPGENMLAPGNSSVIYLELALRKDKLPLQLGHRISIEMLKDRNRRMLTVQGAFVQLPQKPPMISATLSGQSSCPPAKAAGNYIGIDIGNNQIAFYEHLQPGSIRVKTGQIVKKGAVIAAVGFTGQTIGPHLHFHVADRNSTLGAEGIPFVFDRFTVLGAYIDFEKFGKEPWTQIPEMESSSVTAERPAPKSVIRF